MQNGDLSGRAIKSVFKYCGTAVRAAVHFKPCLINLLHCRRWNTEFYLQLIGLDVSTSVGVILPPGLQRIVTLLNMSATDIAQTHTLGAACKMSQRSPCHMKQSQRHKFSPGLARPRPITVQHPVPVCGTSGRRDRRNE